MPDKSPTKILVIDDEPLFLEAFCDVLRREGYAVTAAAGGQAGIDAFQQALLGTAPFAGVFTDFGMRVVDGRQVSLELKALSPQTPVVLITGWNDIFEEPGKLSLPVDGFLRKPPKLAELRAVLARYFGPP